VRQTQEPNTGSASCTDLSYSEMFGKADNLCSASGLIITNARARS
jgi:hypothetical protein